MTYKKTVLYDMSAFKDGSEKNISTEVSEALRRWLQLRFDSHSTAIRPRYDHSTTFTRTVGTAAYINH